MILSEINVMLAAFADRMADEINKLRQEIAAGGSSTGISAGSIELIKHPDNNDPNFEEVIQSGDIIRGFKWNKYGSWNYVSGNTELESSYNRLVSSQIEKQ